MKTQHSQKHIHTYIHIHMYVCIYTHTHTISHEAHYTGTCLALMRCKKHLNLLCFLVSPEFWRSHCFPQAISSIQGGHHRDGKTHSAVFKVPGTSGISTVHYKSSRWYIHMVKHQSVQQTQNNNQFLLNSFLFLVLLLLIYNFSSPEGYLWD